MAYRLLEVHCVVADDSNLSNKAFDRSATIFKNLDLEVAPATIRVAPADAEAVISMGTLTTAKFIAILSDYPVMVRPNGVSATQFAMSVQNVPPVNTGSQAPAMCFWGGTMDITSLRIAPISGATQTATVWICMTGDPLVNYSA